MRIFQHKNRRLLRFNGGNPARNDECKTHRKIIWCRILFFWVNVLGHHRDSRRNVPACFHGRKLSADKMADWREYNRQKNGAMCIGRTLGCVRAGHGNEIDRRRSASSSFSTAGMCRACHANVSQEVAITDLQAVMAEPQFEDWNVTSVAHLFQFALGTHGPQARVLSLEMLRLFVNWYERNQQDGYIPISGLRPMYRQSTIERTIAWLETYDPPEDVCVDKRYADLRANMPSDNDETTSPTLRCVLS